MTTKLPIILLTVYSIVKDFYKKKWGLIVDIRFYDVLGGSSHISGLVLQ